MFVIGECALGLVFVSTYALVLVLALACICKIVLEREKKRCAK